MRSLRMIRFVTLVLVCAIAARKALAQDPRLGARVDPVTRNAVEAIVDTARQRGLPVEPLYDRAFEGAVKGIAGPRIIAAVRTLASNLGVARDALAPDAHDDEVQAGATALHAGTTSADLARLRRAAPHRRLTTTLTAVADLVARDVPPGTAADVLVSLVAAGITDSEIDTFERDIRGDLSRGADPRAATITRARGLIAQRQSIDVANESRR